MALRLSLSPPSIRSSPSLPCNGKQPIAAVSDSKSTCFSSRSLSVTSSRSIGISGGNRTFKVNSSLETAGATVGQVTEVNKDTFWPIVNAAGDKTVVLDMYTQWCGPCRVMAPKFQELSEKYLDVVFLKLDCNQDNKPLAKELGIKVVPTFKILKDNKVVKEVTGAKFDDLVHAIEAVRSS
ncbi:thioredoxin F-type, chloroplastic-like [Momordica charantia]|uniref:Thioredoxin F-type, chloroplastic-like n=1 Tax=Momordica charantia TaxID=3673 RepID=A0A6J1DTK2_MOMCH|nr:thioredoxin F-type, chloroplastic-like [Momordica charantia]